MAILGGDRCSHLVGRGPIFEIAIRGTLVTIGELFPAERISVPAKFDHVILGYLFGIRRGPVRPFRAANLHGEFRLKIGFFAAQSLARSSSSRCFV